MSLERLNVYFEEISKKEGGISLNVLVENIADQLKQQEDVIGMDQYAGAGVTINKKPH